MSHIFRKSQSFFPHTWFTPEISTQFVFTWVRVCACHWVVCCVLRRLLTSPGLLQIENDSVSLPCFLSGLSVALSLPESWWCGRLQGTSGSEMSVPNVTMKMTTVALKFSMILSRLIEDTFYYKLISNVCKCSLYACFLSVWHYVAQYLALGRYLPNIYYMKENEWMCIQQNLCK